MNLQPQFASRILFFIAWIFITGIVTGCGNEPAQSTKQQSSTAVSGALQLPDSTAFRDTINDRHTGLYILKNKNGMQAAFTNYGGRIIGLWIPMPDGKYVDVVVGLKSVHDYIYATEPYFGATIGRYGNRIAKAKFTLDGKEYSLFANNGPNTLHGGKKGLQYVVWDAQQPDSQTLVLSYLSRDGEEGFPGNLDVKVRYSLTDSNELKMEYVAAADKKTVINLTNHAFFNLNGEGSGTINNHILQIHADQYTPVDNTLIPTGELAPVAGTPFDFTNPAAIGARINENHEQLKHGNGYDHNYVLRAGKEGALKHAATVRGDKTGIAMDVYTLEPGMQFYGGNFMQGKNRFKGGTADEFRTAFCLETQHFPDSPNQPNFPSTELAAGQTYRSTSVYKFSIQ